MNDRIDIREVKPQKGTSQPDYIFCFGEDGEIKILIDIQRNMNFHIGEVVRAKQRCGYATQATIQGTIRNGAEVEILGFYEEEIPLIVPGAIVLLNGEKFGVPIHNLTTLPIKLEKFTPFYSKEKRDEDIAKLEEIVR